MLAQNNAQNAIGISRLYLIHINSFIQSKTSAEGTLHVFVANPTSLLICLFVFFIVVERNGKHIPFDANVEILFVTTGGNNIHFILLLFFPDVHWDRSTACYRIDVPKVIVKKSPQAILEDIV